MRRRLLAILCAVALSVALTPPCDARRWESVRSDDTSLSIVAHTRDVEVKVAPGMVVVSSSQQIHIKIFTILGQLVSDDTLPAGSNRLSLSHGVYIVKVGDLTCKIAV